MDVAMTGLGGIEATKRILARRKKPKILGFSQHSDHETVAAMLDAGAVGFVTKTDIMEGLLIGIRAAAAGKSYFSPDASSLLVHTFRALQRAGAESKTEKTLTERELEVVQLIAEGHSAKGIGALLNISSRTAETHRRSAMEKLGLRTTAGLTKWAIQKRLTQPEP